MKGSVWEVVQLVDRKEMSIKIKEVWMKGEQGKQCVVGMNSCSL